MNPTFDDLAAIRARDAQEQPFKQAQADRRMLIKALDARSVLPGLDALPTVRAVCEEIMRMSGESDGDWQRWQEEVEDVLAAIRSVQAAPPPSQGTENG